MRNLHVYKVGTTMSTLWTPCGEHPVERNRSDAAPRASARGRTPRRTRSPCPPRSRRLSRTTPARWTRCGASSWTCRRAWSWASHVLRFFELAGLYLSQSPPRTDDARLAIDALAAVVERLGSRLGEAEAPIRQALHQAQLAFVDAARGTGASAPDA